MFKAFYKCEPDFSVLLSGDSPWFSVLLRNPFTSTPLCIAKGNCSHHRCRCQIGSANPLNCPSEALRSMRCCLQSTVTAAQEARSPYRRLSWMAIRICVLSQHCQGSYAIPCVFTAVHMHNAQSYCSRTHGLCDANPRNRSTCRLQLIEAPASFSLCNYMFPISNTC